MVLYPDGHRSFNRHFIDTALNGTYMNFNALDKIEKKAINIATI